MVWGLGAGGHFSGGFEGGLRMLLAGEHDCSGSASHLRPRNSKVSQAAYKPSCIHLCQGDMQKMTQPSTRVELELTVFVNVFLYLFLDC